MLTPLPKHLARCSRSSTCPARLASFSPVLAVPLWRLALAFLVCSGRHFFTNLCKDCALIESVHHPPAFEASAPARSPSPSPPAPTASSCAISGRRCSEPAVKAACALQKVKTGGQREHHRGSVRRPRAGAPTGHSARTSKRLETDCPEEGAS